MGVQRRLAILNAQNPGASRAGRFALALVGAFAVSSCAGLPFPSTKTQTAAVTATTNVAENRGKVVFSDDFHDSGSGWNVGKLPSGTSFAYQGGEYVSVAVGDLHHYAYSPYDVPVGQLSSTVTATLSTSASDRTGFGVGCGRGQGASRIDYEFLLLSDATWFMERAEGTLNTSRTPSVLKRGTAPTAPGAQPLSLQGLCATFPGSTTTRLVLFVSGHKVGDITDTPSSLPNAAWTAELIIATSGSTPATVRVTSFVERNAAAAS
jgi:hypothetical protein